MNPTHIFYLLVILLQLLPAYAWADTPDLGQGLSPEDVLEMFRNQDSNSDEPPPDTVPNTPFTPIDDTFFDTGVPSSAPVASAPSVSAEQLRRDVQAAGALRERTGNPSNFGLGTTNDQYRIRQQVQDLQRYVREKNDQPDTSNAVPPPQESWNYELPESVQPYSPPVAPSSQTP